MWFHVVLAALMDKYSAEEEKGQTQIMFWEKLIELQVHLVVGRGRVPGGRGGKLYI